MADAFAKTRAIAAKSNDREFHICEFRTGCKREDTAMEAMEPISLQFIGTVAMAPDIEAEKHLPRMQPEFHERALHRGPNSIIAASVAPRALVLVMVIGHGGAFGVGWSEGDLHGRYVEQQTSC